MAHTYFLVSIVALALTSSILNYPILTVVAASLPSVSNTVNGTARCTSLTTCPRATSFSLQQQPKWGPGEIGNVVFGIIAAILGTLTFGFTYFVYIKRSSRHQSGKMFLFCQTGQPWKFCRVCLNQLQRAIFQPLTPQLSTIPYRSKIFRHRTPLSVTPQIASTGMLFDLWL